MSRLVWRWVLVLALVGLLPGMVSARGAAAQGPDDTVEALALRVHLQNMRTYSFTHWIGGDLGDSINSPGLHLTGTALAGWTLTGLAGDADVAATDLERPILLNFWASWCPPCKLEFPHLSGIALAPDEHAFDVLFVDVWDTQAEAEAYLAGYSAELATVVDSGDQLAGDIGLPSIPTSVLLDSDGTVLAVHIGIMTPTVTTFLDAVAADPGVGSFDPADYPDAVAQADLLPIDVEAIGTITYGETVTGEITDEVTQLAYGFEGHAGDAIEVRLEGRGSTLDPYLVVMAEDGTRLGEHDDIEAGIVRDSEVQATLPADGTYIAVATRFLEAEGFENGTFYLTVDLAGLPDGPLPQTGETTLNYGETVSGTISDTQYEERWTFAGTSGDVIDLAMARAVDEAGGLDGYLILEGPDGATLAEVDDAGGSVMPALTSYALPADGVYTVVATRFGFANGFSVGDYTLALDKSGVAMVPPAGLAGSGIRWLSGTELPEGLRRIGYNEPVSGSVDGENLDDWFIFQGREGDVITVRMTADGGDLDSFVLLTDEVGYELARGDDSGAANPTAEIAGFSLPADATYLIRATRYGFDHGTSSGAYTLVVESDAVSVGPEVDVPAVALDFAQIATGVLDLTNPAARYTLEGQAGQWITVHAEPVSGNLVMSLRLIDPQGQVMSVPYAPAPTGAGIRRAVLPADGTYTLEVLLDDFGTSGEYRLIAVAGQPATTDPGAFEPAPGQDIEVVLIWAGEVDLDLEVAGPGALSEPEFVSANDFCGDLRPAPVERAAWAEGTALPGLYTITVRYDLACSGQVEPVPFTLAVVNQGEVELIGGTLSREGDSYTTLLDFMP